MEMEKERIDPTPPTQPRHASSSSSSFQLLSSLPPPLLALAASCLPPVALLRLQRCSSTLHGLRSDESFMAAAWRWTELSLTLDQSLERWTLPVGEWIEDSSEQPFIPLSVWQAALPVWRLVLDRLKGGWRSERQERLHELIMRQQPTRWVLARRRDDDSWVMVDERLAEQSVGVQRMEVLVEPKGGWDFDEDTGFLDNDVEVRCGLVLRACPYLQHLHLAIDAYMCRPPSHEDTFALVPRLRSLRLEQCDSDDIDLHHLIDFRAMLNSLPNLTSLRCDINCLSIAALLELASHSTLEETDISSVMVNEWWTGDQMVFPISVEEDEKQLEMEENGSKLDGDIECEDSEAVEAALVRHVPEAAPADYKQPPNKPLTDSNEEAAEVETTRVAIQRMCTALTRTQPTQLSCEVRLALADWLHRRLRRGKLRTGVDPSGPIHYPKSLLRRYRMQVALLRSTLQHQLSELAAATTRAVSAEASSELGSSELGRASKRARVEE